MLQVFTSASPQVSPVLTETPTRDGRRREMPTVRNRYLRLVPLIAALYGSTACGTEVAVDYVGVCAKPSTGIRLEDEACRDAPDEFVGFGGDAPTLSDGSSWYYFDARRGGHVPAVGSKLTGGSFTTPKQAAGRTLVIVRKGGVPKAGGNPLPSVRRGGLGSPEGKSSGGS